MGRVTTVRLPVVLALVAVLGVTAISAVDDADNATSAADDHHVCTRKARACQPGIMLPIWMPNDNISWMDRAARAIVYLLALVYLFLGVSIIADRFMSSIEVITSSEREVTVCKYVVAYCALALRGCSITGNTGGGARPPVRGLPELRPK